jgi:hypothetical protein
MAPVWKQGEEKLIQQKNRKGAGRAEYTVKMIRKLY